MISVIVPVLNEAETLPGQLAHLCSLHGLCEILVVDGGSSDGTQEIVRANEKAELIEAPRGRGSQIQAGAEAASGEIFLIVHADAQLPGDSLRLIADAVAEGARWGWFDIRYEGSHPWLWLVPRYLNAHAWLLGEPTGENAMWATREAWDEAGGCPQIPLMEDLELARRLRGVDRGRRLPGPVVCSARRYEAWTPVGMSLRCTLLWALFHLGASPETLQRFYPEVR